MSKNKVVFMGDTTNSTHVSFFLMNTLTQSYRNMYAMIYTLFLRYQGNEFSIESGTIVERLNVLSSMLVGAELIAGGMELKSSCFFPIFYAKA